MKNPNSGIDESSTAPQHYASGGYTSTVYREPADEYDPKFGNRINLPPETIATIAESVRGTMKK